MNNDYISINEVFDYVEDIFKDTNDDVGKPYFGHCKRVAEKALGIAKIIGLDDISFFESLVTISLSHDILEDKGLTVENLAELGYRFEDIDNIFLLSKLEDYKGTYQDKIYEIANSKKIKSIIIKIADNMDNSDPIRNENLPEHKKSIIKRYNIAIEKLLSALKEFMIGNKSLTNDEIENIILNIKNERIELDETKRIIAINGKEILQELRMANDIQKIIKN